MNPVTRRTFAASIGSAAFALQSPQPRPNILWLTSEDIGPQLGVYGDRYALTPNLDKFAANSLRYDCCWSNAPVCAPARTAIISGMYPPSLGAEHMRSLVSLPANMKMLPQYLREAGYYCTNNAKEDYNLRKPGQVWDESSFAATYKNRPARAPFFAVFNFGITHESQVIARRPTLAHDPGEAKLPSYYPDTPEIRRDVAQYYDNITTMDRQFAVALQQLEQAGVADNTIIFFYGDNGRCLPRGKRIPYNSGLNVPLLIHVPEKLRHLAPAEYKPGGSTDRPVSFVDLAPTVLSIAGVAAPSHFQGHALMGPKAAPAHEHIFGFRGRMDERTDMMRATRDRRYIYVRNYMPHRLYGEHVTYQWQEAGMRDWDNLAHEGKLKGPQTLFWNTKPYEELYDLSTDPDEVHNLAASKAHQAVLTRLRRAQDDWMRDIKDVGLLAEPEMQSRAAGSTPYEMGHDPKRFNYAPIKQAADRAAFGNPSDLPQLRKDLTSEDSGIRYWAATGLLIRKEKAVTAAAAELTRALDDPSPSVRIAAAEALGRYGPPDAQARAVKTLVALGSAGKNGFYASNLAWDALDHLPTDLVRPSRAALEALDYGSQPDVAAPGRAGRGGRGPVLRDGSFDLFGAGVEDEAVRAAGSSASMRATVLEKLR